MRLAFAGTPDFAVPHLNACRMPGVDIVAVYTQPDRPAGRGRHLAPSPVKQAATASGYAVEQPETLKLADVQARLQSLDLDLLVVVAYGLILPRNVLATPRLGCWNVHASLLPRWRGAAPIQRAILAGDRKTGVCVMQMEKGLDTGPVLLRRELPIADDDTGGSLHDKLAALGATALRDALQTVLDGQTLSPQPQSDDGATYAHKIDKAEASIDWTDNAIAIERKVRAFDPWPIAEADVGNEHLRIWSARGIRTGANRAPGSIVTADKNGIDVATGDGILRILQVQRAGGRRMAVEDYLNARRDVVRAP
ncbi:MAG TPA: methionyl-tRNA formyltransferase [Rudaea sp.]|nr:methionyl-tRNA formyltransferase [Rudaea sp.]